MASVDGRYAVGIFVHVERRSRFLNLQELVVLKGTSPAEAGLDPGSSPAPKAGARPADRHPTSKLRSHQAGMTVGQIRAAVHQPGREFWGELGDDHDAVALALIAGEDERLCGARTVHHVYGLFVRQWWANNNPRLHKPFDGALHAVMSGADQFSNLGAGDAGGAVMAGCRGRFEVGVLRT